MSLRVLESGACEGLKLGVHGLALGLSSLMCLYNAAAWLQRRERHLAANTLIYGAATLLEQQHVAHHWCAVRRVQALAALAAATEAEAEAEAATTVAAKATVVTGVIATTPAAPNGPNADRRAA